MMYDYATPKHQTNQSNDNKSNGTQHPTARLVGGIVRLEVLLGAVGVGLDGVGARRPGGGTRLAHVAICPLESLQQT